MSRRIAEFVTGLAAVLGFAALAGAQPQAPAKPQASAPPAKEAAPPPAPEKLTAGLEEMLTSALRNNPDIRVAEAKLHEAEAELNRIRLQVMQKVITFRHAVETQKAAVLEAELGLKDKQRLAGTGALPQQMLREAQAALEKAKATLATVEAEMPSLLGKLPQSVSPAKNTGQAGKAASAPPEGLNLNTISSTTFNPSFLPSPFVINPSPFVINPSPFVINFPELTNTALLSSGLIQTAPAVAVYSSLNAPIQTSMAERIRKALDTPVTVEYKEKPLLDVLKDLQHKQGLTVIARLAEGRKAPVLSFHFPEPIPFGAVLEAIEDLSGVRMAVRDYGILVTDPTQLPAGAIPLHEFWKGHIGADKAQAARTAEPAANPARNSFLPQEIEGIVKATAPENGYVTLSIGSQAGLGKGQTLEVYRLKPEPFYLGSVEIVDVRPNEAVGKPITKPRSPIQVGDRVASRISRRDP